jgi:hypothetical protein
LQQFNIAMIDQLITAHALSKTCHGLRDKSKADVGEHIEVKWSANPASNLWIQESDRHDRDIAVLVTGNAPKMHIVGWMPVAVAKKPRYRNASQNNWSVPQINLQPIETLMRSNYAHPSI